MVESDEIVNRTLLHVRHSHVEYSLTPRGHGVGKRVRLLTDWIKDHTNSEDFPAQEDRSGKIDNDAIISIINMKVYQLLAFKEALLKHD